MTAGLSAFDLAVAELVALGKSRDVAEQLVRSQLPHLAPARIEVREDALEDEHVEKGDDLMRALGFDVVKLSQKRRSKVHEGLPDRRYYHVRRRLFCWWEAKAAWGRQSPAQRDFQWLCDATGDPYVLGGLDALKDWLVAAGVCFAFDPNGLPMPTPTPEPAT